MPFSESSRTEDFAPESVGHDGHRKEHVPAPTADAGTTAMVTPFVSSTVSREPRTPDEQVGVPWDLPGSAIEALEDRSAAQRHRAANVLSALADLVSASTDAAAQEA